MWGWVGGGGCFRPKPCRHLGPSQGENRGLYIQSAYLFSPVLMRMMMMMMMMMMILFLSGIMIY